MAAQQTVLDVVRQRTIVDCDTMDEEVANSLGPFHDCTSNQAIAYAELSKPKHTGLIAAAVIHAGRLLQEFPDIGLQELAVEIAMIKLALKIAPHVTGHVHIQTNPYYVYSIEKTICNARRIIQVFQSLQPGFPPSRICITIPATWEGLMACRTLARDGVHTLATMLFSLEQAVLAEEVGCTYVAPYVNQLRVHFEPGYTDSHKSLHLSVRIQRYYESIKAKTQVLSASLTSTAEIVALAGVNHITIPPSLLRHLEKPISGPQSASLFDIDLDPGVVPSHRMSFLHDESAYRLAVTKDISGRSEKKLIEAINIFCGMQDRLARLVGCGGVYSGSFI